MPTDSCCLCDSHISAPNLHGLLYDCKYCGKYRLNAYVIDNYREEILNNIHNIRGFLKENDPYLITNENITDLIRKKPPLANEKLEKFLFFLYKNSDFGEVLNVA